MQPSGDWVSGPCSGLRAAKSVGGSARKRIAERDYLWIRAELIKPPIRDSGRRGHVMVYRRECVSEQESRRAEEQERERKKERKGEGDDER